MRVYDANGNYETQEPDTDGDNLWNLLFGSSTTDRGYDIAVDTDGNIVVAGVTFGSFPGESNQGSGDIFVSKFSPAGSNLWHKQFGTSASDVGEGVVLDAAATPKIYMTGTTSEDFDAAGSECQLIGGSDVLLMKIEQCP